MSSKLRCILKRLSDLFSSEEPGMFPREAHQYFRANSARLCACFYANLIQNAWFYCPHDRID